MKIDLTDQELNEWVAKTIMGHEVLGKYDSIDGELLVEDNNWAKQFDPCHDLNHTHLMEEKLMEIGKMDDYYSELVNIIRRTGLHRYLTAIFLVHASARQRCEAAFLTFKEG